MNMENNLKAKSFWERKEGTTGMITIGLGVLGVALSADWLIGLFGKMITLLGQGITIAVLGCILFAIVMVITNKKFQMLVSYMFKSAMRTLTGWFVEIDPIGIMRNYISESEKKRESMNESIAKLNGQIKNCEKNISDNEKTYTKSLQEFKIAREQGKSAAMTLASRQMERMQKMNEEQLKPIHAQMTVHLKALRKYHEATDIIIQDMRAEVDAQHKLREMMKASYGAMSMAKKIMQGGDERELYDMALESAVTDFGMKLGEIENFMENSKGFIESLDIANGVADAKALERLKAWEEETDSVVLGKQKRQLLEHSPVEGVVMPALSTIDYTELLDNKIGVRDRKF